MLDIVMYMNNGDVIHVEKGTGDNLLREDIEAGYVDYLNWTKFQFENGEFVEKDGGMILLEEPCEAPRPINRTIEKEVVDAVYDKDPPETWFVTKV